MVSRDALIIFEENVLTEVSSQQADPSFVKQLKDFEKKKHKKRRRGIQIYLHMLAITIAFFSNGLSPFLLITPSLI